MQWLKKIWDAIKPDPYYQIAQLMWVEGYRDDEIDREIYQLKKANGNE